MEGAQAWTIKYNEIEQDYTPMGTYEDLEFSDQEEEDDDGAGSDLETKETRDGMQNAMKVPRDKPLTAVDPSASQEKAQSPVEELKQIDEEEEKEEEKAETGATPSKASKTESKSEDCNPLGNFIDKLKPAQSQPAKPEKKSVPTEDGDLLWMKHVDHKDNTYLCLVNQSGKTIKKGDQIMFFYGKYTSPYLLLNYGFCYRDNRYDQVDVSL